ncbi:xanthine dehydrogenase family protein subunit M [Magnetospira sp. QH-2]|uniref:FAD binding domain-containing protein n=1 Tax=Magnetospira sp. (strain QH-2) TaxID=1288970 RepID=UPI0003E81013|nr:FAD binding domain-containing protein [Magnetospira sp. QH-2]CCQ75120.1 putative xanthine dehydrogenase, FAD-binding subunit [Magnetospira sp. QH-2]
MLSCDQYLTPKTLHEALQAWSGAPQGSRLLAGATDTLPWARQGRAGDLAGDAHVPTIVDVSGIPEHDGYQVLADGRVSLGANVVFEQFLDDPELAALLPHMRFCAVWFADDQIRRQATLAGNVVNASPAADGVPPLVALNATVELARLEGDGIARRSVPVATFITGPGQTDLQPGEMVTGISCETAKGYGGAFEKVGQRRSLVISTACASCCVKPFEDGRLIKDIRLALGGVGPVPMRLDDVEDFLRGQPITGDIIAQAAEMPMDRVASRTRRDYRRAVVKGFTERAILHALADAGVVLADEMKVAHG